MGRPSKEELASALAEAGRMREQGEDPHHVAKCLLNHDYRLKLLEPSSIGACFLPLSSASHLLAPCSCTRICIASPSVMMRPEDRDRQRFTRVSK